VEASNLSQNHLSELRDMSRIDWIRVRERIAYSLVLPRGALICPNIEVTKQFDAAKFVDT
jgi:hypothetical protein